MVFVVFLFHLRWCLLFFIVLRYLKFVFYVGGFRNFRKTVITVLWFYGFCEINVDRCRNKWLRMHLTSYANFNGQMVKLSQKGIGTKFKRFFYAKLSIQTPLTLWILFRGIKITIISIIRFLQL